MKKITTLLAASALAITTFAYAQEGGYIIHNQESDKNVSLENVIGSPYYNAEFSPAIIGDSQTESLVRYNAFLDVVEVSENNSVHELPKTKENSIIKLKKSSETLTLVQYSGEYDGYYILLADGKNQLLKKIKIRLFTEKSTITPDSQTKPGQTKYDRQKPAYFIKTETQIINIPKNAKDLAFYFPEHKDDLNNFIKTNKIKLNKEEDLIKLVQFLNQ